jgi:hypothetical protein
MGALKHHKTEGGHGGRRGHSNMDHWGTTAEIKDATRGLRRREGRAVIEQEVGRASGANDDSAPGDKTTHHEDRAPKSGRVQRSNER